MKDLTNIYINRPFKIRNADEYDLSSILDLFIDPTDGLSGPFEFTNSIIKGKMGSGKTMYLRANYAYYLYTLVPCLIEAQEIILPVYIRLSDFANIQEPEKIYNELIIKIIEEIVNVCTHLRSSEALAKLHTGASSLIGLWSYEENFIQIFNKLKVLTADEYVEKITNSFGTKGSLSYKFLNACTSYEKDTVSEIKKHSSAKFSDIVDTCNKLLSPFNGKLILLLDEIGSTNKNFFKRRDKNPSYFEVLMNQLRTLPYVRTKLAVYPHSHSDILRETRYGETINLEYDSSSPTTLLDSFVEKTVSMIERYIEKAVDDKWGIEEVFDLSVNNQLLIEQLLNATEGNMRRLVHLLDSSMDTAFMRHKGTGRITLDDVLNTLRKQASEMEKQYRDVDKTFLASLTKMCKKRSTYRFSFPNRSKNIKKFTSFSEEYNIIKKIQTGTGRQSSVYCFDYAYCIYKDLPTHYIKDTEKIDKRRSILTGEPIKRIAQLSEELLLQSEIKGKIEGTITFLTSGNETGFVTDDEGNSYFISTSSLISVNKKNRFVCGQRLCFLPDKQDDKFLFANEIEIL